MNGNYSTFVHFIQEIKLLEIIIIIIVDRRSFRENKDRQVTNESKEERIRNKRKMK